MQKTLGQVLEPLMRTDEVASYLRTDPATIRRWARAGRIKARWVGRQWLIRREDLAAFIESGMPHD
jgi:excisionase family DNA binding protein